MQDVGHAYDFCILQHGNGVMKHLIAWIRMACDSISLLYHRSGLSCKHCTRLN